MDTLMDSSVDGERVFSYGGVGEMVDAQTAHDKLNLMIVRGQDPASYIDSFNSTMFQPSP